MRNLFKDYLFNKHILVAEKTPSDVESFNTLVALANKFGINITEGKELACKEMIQFAADCLCEYVPQPFYEGFPNSVLELTKNELLFDQVFHYFITYGTGNFDEAGHSIFEEEFKRLAFNEDTTPKDFVILDEKTAGTKLCGYMLELLGSSRPLSESNYEVVLEFLKTYICLIERIPCRQTAVKLLYDTGDVYRFIRHLELADTIKLVDYINYTVYHNENLKKLNLRNKDRKIITKMIDTCFEDVHNQVRIAECFEKRKIWCGLLHHIHYQPKTEEAKAFVDMIRSGKNCSVYSHFETMMRNGNVVNAAELLAYHKGNSVLIRNLNYLLSRCKTEEEAKGVLQCLK